MEAKSRLMNHSLQNISALQTQEQRIKEDIRKATEMNETFISKDPRLSEKYSINRDNSIILRHLTEEAPQ